MKPLLFLSYKSFLNGLIRALSSPRRVIGVLFFVGYYFMVFLRPTFTQPLPSRLTTGPTGVLEFPPLQIIDALVFGIFSLLTMFMMMGTATQLRGFQPADVDVLFATPISPKVVLLFRMARDYFFTLIVPFIIVLFGLRPVQIGWVTIFRNMPNPEYSSMAIRLTVLGWILLSMVWVTINYSFSLAINRSDLKSDRNRRIAGWTISALLLGAIAYVAWSLSRTTSAEDAMAIANSPVLRSIFFTATLATKMTMSAFHANVWEGLTGFGGMVAIIAICFAYAFRNAGWMYDQAAVKGFKSKTMRDLQRKGDTFAMLAESARSGKVKAGRATWMFRLQWQGAAALVWKELILQGRGLWGMWAGLGLLGVAMGMMALFIEDKEMAKPVLFFVMQGSAVFMATTALSQTGFIELLRRVDLQKPLPFKPQVTVAYEILSKSLLGAATCVLSSLVAMIIQPYFWQPALGAMILMPCVSYLLSSTMFLVIVLFPDLDDPSQKQFRGLMMMLGTVLMLVPGIATFAILWTLGLPIPLAAIVAGAICVGTGILVSYASGGIYASYNPSE